MFVNSSTLLVIDSGVADPQHFMDAATSNADILILNPQQDGIVQITDVLTQKRNLRSLQILAHGCPGELQLGNTRLNFKNLADYTPTLQQWKTALQRDADLLLYGCCVGAGETGQQFIHQLAKSTQISVAASTGLIGNPALGGNWHLDIHTAKIDSTLAIQPTALAAYPAVLVLLVTESFTNDTLTAQPFTDELSWIFGTQQSVNNPDDRESPFLTAREDRNPQLGGIPGILNGFTPDEIGKGALQLTADRNDETGFIIYDFPVRSDAGLEVEFDFHAYSGSGADGFSFFLIDGETSPQQSGGFGGSLGYAPRTDQNRPGLLGGYLGIGFDEFGNFANGTEGRNGGVGRIPDSITLRGSEDTNYEFLTTTGQLDLSIDVPNATTRDEATRSIEIFLTQAGLLSIALDSNFNGIFEPDEVLIEDFDVQTANGGDFPETFKFGFAASTGRFTNIHEISNVKIATLEEPPILDLDVTALGVDFETIFLAGQGAVEIANETFIIDEDDETISSATIILTNPLNFGEEQLNLTAAGQDLINDFNLTVSGEGTSQLEITGITLKENYAAVIDEIVYDNIAENPDLTPRQIESIVRDKPDENGFDSNLAVTTIEIDTTSQNLPPMTEDISNPPIRNDAIQISLLPLEGSDPDGEVVSFRITALPINGTLFFDNNPINQTTETIPFDQAGDLQFTPNSSFVGTTTFQYAAIDNDDAEDPSPATFFIPVTPGNQPPQTQDIIADFVRTTAVQAPIPALQGSDSDGTVEGFRITELPNRGTLFLDDEPLELDQVIGVNQADALTFTPNSSQFFDSATFQYAAIDNEGAQDPSPALYLIPTIDNFPPIAEVVVQSPISPGSTQVPIDPPPSGEDVDGTIEGFSVSTLPENGQLFLAGQLIEDTENVQNLEINLATQLSFTPDPDFIGNDRFEYTVTDNDGVRSFNRGSIILPVIDETVTNIPPIVNNISLTPIRNDAQQVTIPPLDGEDMDGEIVSFSFVRLSANGQLFVTGELISPDQILTPEQASQLTYTPNSGFVGTSTFSYTATDNEGAMAIAPALLSIPVTPGNQPPVTDSKVSLPIANNSTEAEVPPLSGTDSDGIVVGFQITQLPLENTGRLVFDGSEITNLDQLPEQLTPDQADTLSFNPNSEFVGNGVFQYAAVDNEGAVDPSPAAITLPIVPPTNIPPQAQNVTFLRLIDRDEQQVQLSPLQAQDVDGTIESFALITLPVGGLFLGDGTSVTDLNQVQDLSPTAATELLYTPDPNFPDVVDIFTFTATDNEGATALFPASYILPIAAIEPVVNQPPTTDNLRNPAIPEGSVEAELIPLSGSDADGEVVEFRITQLPEVGELFVGGEAVNADMVIPVEAAGNLTFTPPPEFTGFTDFSYAAVDDAGDEDLSPALFTLPVIEVITPVNQRPITDNLRNPPLTPGSVEAELIPLSGSDPDGEVVAFRITQLPEVGQLFVEGEPVNAETVVPIEAAGNLTFTPPPEFTGFTDFSYAAVDDAGDEDLSPALFTIPVVASLPPVILPPTQPPIIIDPPQPPLGRDDELEALCNFCEEIPQFNGIVLPPIPSDEIILNVVETTITGTHEDDILIGSVLNEAIAALEGNDLISGLGGNDNLFGDGDDDILVAGEGHDVVDGGTGEDILFGTLGTDTLVGNFGDDSLFGGTNDLSNPDIDGQDILQGNGGNDFLAGNENDDTLRGNDGNDQGFGGKGNDQVYGDFGRDTLFGNLGNDTLIADPGRQSTTVIQAEPDIIFGNAGEDLLHGGPGNDTLHGGQGDDFNYGGLDNDLLWGELGNDTLFGDLGDDTLQGNLGEDALLGGEGNDRLAGDENTDTLLGGIGDDLLRGGTENDQLFGEMGNDELFGDAGNDLLCGNQGNDTLYGDLGSDQPVGNIGGQDLLCGGAGDDLLYANEGQDVLCGDEGNDTLYGGKDNDTLVGLVGNDVLWGDQGNDTISGGEGQDQFVITAASGSDVITDFMDTLDLIGLAGELTFADLTIESMGENTLIRFNGALLITLNGITASQITESDFVAI